MCAGTLLIRYAKDRYGMEPKEFIFFITYLIIVSNVGSAIALIIFSKWMSMHDCVLGMIGTTSEILTFIVYGLAPNIDLFYNGPVFDLFTSTGGMVIRSLGTKIVDPDKVVGRHFR
ncbi:hypothetical protein evm_015277 [Chilo suppressalis]|nr:hypothetical protein evm_015277 [Chilo suppressalis]